MAIEIGDVVRAVAKINMPDEVDANNVWDWVRTDDEPTSPTNNAVAAALASKLVDIYGEIEPDLSDLVTVVSCVNYKMGYDAGEWIVEVLMGEEAVGVQGDNTGEMLPHGVAGLITLGTNYSRRFGRRFFAGLTEAAVTDGTFLGPVVAGFIAAADEYLDPIILSSIYEFTPKLLANDGTPRSFTSAAGSGTPAYQRRRKPGVGS